MSPRHLLLLVLLLLAPGLAWADPLPGILLYENGEYEAAAQSFTQVLADPQRSPQERGLARVYLAASLHALGRVEETRQQLEVLAREHPEQRVDAVRFLPELVALAEAIRQRVDTEREYARKEAERERMAREEAARRPLPAAPTPPAWVRPEVRGLVEAVRRQWTVGVGLAYHQGPLEGSVGALFNNDPRTSPPSFSPTFHLQGGVLLGSGALRPHLGLRAILVPGMSLYGGGAVVGLRWTLPAGLVALTDVGAEYTFISSDNNSLPFAVTAQAGLGFDLRLPGTR